MIIYISLDENKRVTGWSEYRENELDIQINVPVDHEFRDKPYIYKYVDGQLIKDEAYQQELIDKKQNRKSEVAILKDTVDQLVLDNLMRGL